MDLGVKIFYTLFKKAPDTLKLFPHRDDAGKPILAELKKLGLRTFVAFGDIVDGLDNAEKTSQIFEHLVRCVLWLCSLATAGFGHNHGRHDNKSRSLAKVPPDMVKHQERLGRTALACVSLFLWVFCAVVPRCCVLS